MFAHSAVTTSKNQDSKPVSFLMFIYDRTCVCTKAEDEEKLELEIEMKVFGENLQTKT